MSVSDIFDEFDKLHRAALDEHKQAETDQQQRRELVVSLMKNVVKPFADQAVQLGQLRNISVGVDDRGNDPHRPSYTVQLVSYENGRPINGDRPTIKVTATEDCRRIEVAEELGDLDDSFANSKKYHVEMGQPNTLSEMTKALEGWLRETVTRMAKRK